jgi:hypothetical protein
MITILMATLRKEMPEFRTEEIMDLDGRIMLEFILQEQYGRLWTGFIWLRIGTKGGLL